MSGSDPQTNNPDGTPKFPEEFRIEVYVPPYLTQGLPRPTFNLTETDWAYGGQYQINVNLATGPISNMRVSLVAGACISTPARCIVFSLCPFSATSSTHGNVMGGRTIFPEVSCAGGTTCTITAPPNSFVSPPGWWQIFVLDGPTPSISQWIRIGGDPGELGSKCLSP